MTSTGSSVPEAGRSGSEREAAVRPFRWRAIVPAILFLILLVVLWALFADRLAGRAVEHVGSRIVGAEVEIDELHLAPGAVTVRGLTVASPFEALRNLVEAEEIAAEVALLPLLEKKILIRHFAATGLRFGTSRERDGRLPGGGGVLDAQEWADRLDFPALQLATGEISIDTLDPRNLQTVQQAEALLARADSGWEAWEDTLASLERTVTGTVDSANAVLQRLRNARLTDVALLNDARTTVEEVKRTSDRLAEVETELGGWIDSLRSGVSSLDAARRRDYEFARSLVKLPSFDASTIGDALFGRLVAGSVARALHWASLARRYMPPGLDPRSRPGPPRVRQSGVNVQFPRPGELPGFLLERGELSFLLGSEEGSEREYGGRLTGLTSAPALYGLPTTFEAWAPQVRLAALFDHTGGVQRDTGAVELTGIDLAPVGLPGLPIRLDPERINTSLSFALVGDSLRARWTARSDRVSWAADSGFVAEGGQLADVVWRAVSGISSLDISAQLSGTLSNPRISVSSNVDDELAARLQAVLGEELARIEGQLRERVDRLVDDRVEPVRTRIANLDDAVAARLGPARSSLEEARAALDERLREITRLPIR